jgi:Putative DNA-binding domain
MLKLETRDDLQSLIDDEIPESLTLEYKSSAGLAKDSKSRDELCKDVSAFANSSGGQIVYGIEEKNNKPVRIDVGSDMPREWIEQVINSNIHPRIRGLIITPISLEGSRQAFVLTVPTSNTAHQAPDKKYYRRFNFESVAMYDYEIRDVMNRSTTPELFVLLRFYGNSQTTLATYNSNNGLLFPVKLHVSVGNRSTEPALYSVVEIDVDAQLEIKDDADFRRQGPIVTSKGHSLHSMIRVLSIPSHLPIFKEVQFNITDRPISFWFQTTASNDQYLIRTKVITPGFTETRDWIIERVDNKLTLNGPLEPTHPL